jgi:hypothetical protein
LEPMTRVTLDKPTLLGDDGRNQLRTVQPLPGRQEAIDGGNE